MYFESVHTLCNGYIVDMYIADTYHDYKTVHELHTHTLVTH